MSHAGVAGRAEALLAALAAEIDRHRHELDGYIGLRAVFFEVRFRAGGGHPRSVVMKPEYENLLTTEEPCG
ncbi:MAG: hypothetical protein ACE5JS_21940, partial [Nitrospinota bacterium]